MIDLQDLFREAHEQHEAPRTSGFPVSGEGQPERQAINNNNISGVSGVSGAKKTNPFEPTTEHPRARAGAGAGAGAGARGVYAGGPETPETPEMHLPAGRYLSGSLLRKPEKERETGNTDVLPAVDDLALWRAGLARLDPDRPPCPGYRHRDWEAVLARAFWFLRDFGEQAEALGWTAPRLFGVHREAGIVRVDACGALVLPSSGRVRAITATEVSFGHLTHREKLGQPVGVPLWTLGQ